ncbi:thioredoxin domain-containing protein [Desulfovibrio ferrophilus]|uniref:Spermatogenesis-associated protein 20-like TRX domain-containing protein n=1 Tax=Desulfovibrio ferrophilus TaxID=241368 RepID=A0A2Z6AVH9_9BACT|nr:thioredoxin domain-containing protein [Desulfovibrio ferrophilus]BBD07252.1 uncharacterized protein DFE_0526 [Desulfovibrio ferrophilus]
MTKKQPPNSLIHEKSPYLQQHAHNPVDWKPWGPEAFEIARREDKPVLLSIGYSTCHWCHVMERESFEDDEVATALNETFVCIKADREERPDVDAVYMTACQMITGRGGWPLTALLTPDGLPFLAGTYLPPRNRFGTTGLLELTRAIGEHWAGDRAKLLENSDQMRQHLADYYADSAKGGSPLDGNVSALAEQGLSKRYDVRLGGFSEAPKFPTPFNLTFLLGRYAASGDERLLEMVRHTLTRMRLGGLFDHVGFGFHRYSTDERWLVPHFEKMLYDQAGIATACLELHRVSGNAFLAQTAHEIFEYVLRDLAHPEGGFFAAEDADSEGEEGLFYLWKAQELIDILGVDEAGPLSTLFRVETHGNFRDESTKQPTGLNILHLRNPLEGTDGERWEQNRKKLFEVREQRIRPHRDEKILADWNGQMIATLALGASILNEQTYAEAAARAADFVLQKMCDASGNLLHRWVDGEAAAPGTAEDHAFMIQGLLQLHRTTGDSARLEQAVALQTAMDSTFLDQKGGGYFLSQPDALLPVRPKELHDGPAPSANSQALHNLLDLAELTGNKAWRQQAQTLSNAFADNVRNQPGAYTHFLAGMDRLLAIES